MSALVVPSILERCGISGTIHDQRTWEILCNIRTKALQPEKVIEVITIEDNDDDTSSSSSLVQKHGCGTALASFRRSSSQLSLESSSNSAGSLVVSEHRHKRSKGAQQLIETFSKFTKEELVQQLVAASDRNARQTLALKRHKIQRRLAAKKQQALSNQLAVVSDKLTTAENQIAIVRKTGQEAGRGSRLTLASTFAVGIRRAMLSASSADFGLAVLDDMSRQTVCRCAIKSAGALVASSRMYFANMLLASALEVRCSEFGSSDDDGDHASFDYVSSEFVQVPITAGMSAAQSEPFSLNCIVVRCDATSSSIWQRRKLHVLEITAAYVNDFDKFKSGDFKNCVRETTIVADLQAVPDGTANTTLALILKQLASVGCPSWRQLLRAHRTFSINA